jgi:hypothetical protein
MMSRVGLLFAASVIGGIVLLHAPVRFGTPVPALARIVGLGLLATTASCEPPPRSG